MTTVEVEHITERLTVGAHYMTPGGSVFRLCERPPTWPGGGWIWAYPNDLTATVTDDYVTRPLRRVYFKRVAP